MLLHLLSCFVIVTLAYPEEDVISENGTVSDKVQGRIYGGAVLEDEDEDENYFQVQISRENADFCSGAIFNERYILTAAHCVEGAKPEDVIVRGGSRFLGQGMLIPIDQIVQHPDYDYPQLNCDIAYMRMRDTLDFSRKHNPTLLPVHISEDELPEELEINGWGYQGVEDSKMKLSDQIYKAVLPIISNAECQFYYGTMITKNMLCGYRILDKSEGACKGDGGGPAIMEGSTRLLGISSFTLGCGDGMEPSVFTYVQAREIRDFIRNGTRIPEDPSKRAGHHYHNPGRTQTPPKRPDNKAVEQPEHRPSQRPEDHPSE